MKKIYIILITLFSILSASSYAQNLSGYVFDAKTGVTIVGAQIALPSYKRGAVTDANGYYHIEGLPKTVTTVQVSFVGYYSISKTIDLSKVNELNFSMEFSVTEMSEMVVTGQAGYVDRKSTPSPITLISNSDLQKSSSTNLIDALAKQPGVSEVSTGAAISKPVIRGLGYNRVLVINDGVRQEGQQWGDEHGIEIDEYSVNSVEIVKGPASLAYGSDAMAGVINTISAPSLPEGEVKANVLANYQSNNNMFGYSADVKGNNNNWLWGLQVGGKRANDYENSIDGNVDNSAFSENAFKAMFGRNRKHGYTHVDMSYYFLEPEIASLEEHSHDDEEEHDHDEEEGEDHDDHDDHDHDEESGEFQRIYHYKASVENKDYLGGKSSLTEVVGFQQNRRTEYENPDEYSLYMRLNTLSYDIKYQYETENDLKVTAGVGGMYQQSLNLGNEFLIPDYDLFDIGAYAIVYKKFGKLNLSGGLRYDVRNIDSKADVSSAETSPSVDPFNEFNSSYSGLSASFGATYQLSKEFYTKFNISQGYRSPNIAELGSNGAHHGSYQYQVGDPNLKSEQSLQMDLGLGFDSKHVLAEVSLFSNHINNYTYSHKLLNSAGNDSIIDDYSVFKYTQGDAHLYGGEIYVDIHPHSMHWLHFENTLSYTRGELLNQPDSLSNLPQIPPLRWQSELKIELGRLSRFTNNSFVSFGILHSWEQDKYFEAYNTETYTPAYTLMNASIGTDFTLNGKRICSLYLVCKNLADKAYQDHLSRLKYAGHNDETGKEGYYNMGRNFSVKVLFPIG